MISVIAQERMGIRVGGLKHRPSSEAATSHGAAGDEVTTLTLSGELSLQLTTSSAALVFPIFIFVDTSGCSGHVFSIVTIHYNAPMTAISQTIFDASQKYEADRTENSPLICF